MAVLLCYKTVSMVISSKLHKRTKKDRAQFITTHYCINNHYDIIYIHTSQI